MTEPFPGEQLEAARERLEQARALDGDAAPEQQALLAAAYDDLHALVEHLQAASDSRQLLAQTTALLATSLDYEATLQRVARLAVPAFADYCIVDMFDADRSLRQVAVAHTAPGKETLVRELRQLRPFDPNLPYGVSKVLRTGQAELVQTVPPIGLPSFSTSVEHLDILRQLAPVSYIVAPLVARGRTLGAVSFISSESGRHYGQADLDLATELANRAALAVDNARLYHDVQEALLRKDEARALLDTLLVTAPVGLCFLDPQLRFVLINDAMAAMNGRRSDDHIGKHVEEVIPGAGADLIDIYRRVLETGEPALDHEISGMTLADQSRAHHFLASYYPVDGPDGQRLGIGAVVTDITDRKRGEELLRFVARASSILAASLDYQTTLQTVARLVVPYLADWCGVDLLEEDGSVKQVAVAHVQPEKVEWARKLRANYPLDMNAPTGIPAVLRTGKSEFYGPINDAMLVASARDEAHLRLMREVGFNSVMIVPLVARGRTLGALSFVSAESGRRYTEADLRVAEDLAHRAATAVDNARLYQEAQEAVHVRDEFLSIAAHELKTPVTSLLAYAQVLERRAVREKTASERDLRALQVIGEQANRLSRLIISLLDLSRIETGHFTIERANVDLALLARRAVEEMQPTLDQHVLAFTSPLEPLIIEGDEMRLEQAIQNLLQNAVKYSPSGGTIAISVERNGDRAALAISDQGMGIPEDAQGQLFQRFFRARNVDGSHISGMGIGLYVVKEIINRHGGQVYVRSKEGEGTTFTVVLPLVSQPGAGGSSGTTIPSEDNAAA